MAHADAGGCYKIAAEKYREATVMIFPAAASGHSAHGLSRGEATLMLDGSSFLDVQKPTAY